MFGNWIKGENYLGVYVEMINPTVQETVNYLVKYLREVKANGSIYIYGLAITANLMPWEPIDIGFDTDVFPMYYTDTRRINKIDLRGPNTQEDIKDKIKSQGVKILLGGE